MTIAAIVILPHQCEDHCQIARLLERDLSLSVLATCATLQRGLVASAQRKRINVVLSQTLAFAIGPMITPGLIVFILNDVTDSYPEIQSWQCAYILSGVTVGVVGITNLLYADWYHYGDEVKNRQFWDLLLLPFGFKSGNESTDIFILPLLSLAPAIVGGYIANFILERKYILECDEQYNPISTMCEDGVCCITVSSHESWFDFMPKLGGSVVTAWGAVKFIGIFIMTYGEFVDIEEEAKDTMDTQSDAGVAGGRTKTVNEEERAQ